MRMRYFGDSYDIVKQSFLRWLRSFGEWSVHPMFTEPVTPNDVDAFQALLGAKIVSTEVLTRDTDRSKYFSCARCCGHLFLDPDTGLLLDSDTGLRMRSTRGVRAPQYLFASELVRMSEQRPKSLTLLFDQSVGRGSERAHLKDQLRHLRHHGVFGTAFVSHACFVIAGRDRGLVEHARTQIITESKLPPSRFLPRSRRITKRCT